LAVSPGLSIIARHFARSCFLVLGQISMRTLAGCSWSAIGAFALTSVAGCAPEAQRLANTIPHPGPAGYQRAEAIHHDPYLLDDVGPEVVGARPREYQRPLNEVERARLDTIPPPGVAVPRSAAPPIVAPAYPGAPTPAPIVTMPAPTAPVAPALPAAPPAQATPFQYQQRPPY
jgi:hypothetical protein